VCGCVGVCVCACVRVCGLASFPFVFQRMAIGCLSSARAARCLMYVDSVALLAEGHWTL
jgi:hypothetical protein